MDDGEPADNLRGFLGGQADDRAYWRTQFRVILAFAAGGVGLVVLGVVWLIDDVRQRLVPQSIAASAVIGFGFLFGWMAAKGVRRRWRDKPSRPEPNA